MNVWCGIIDTSVLGPIFYNVALTSARYLHLLQHEVEVEIGDKVTLDILLRMWLPQDRAPPHFGIVFRNLLDYNRCPQKWLGRGDPVSWPLRSPDLTKKEFFLWGYIKAKVYETEQYDVRDLQQCM